ncbi:hypothetical protein G205_01998 [Arthrobacter nitrophenolicus]|uniref:Uncharacterized protein n=2 Tax=Arthrobacter nitrophenolicus TaxID=683150 RepID=L8TVZ7_9MICC|nr:hypothetical protein G205_01998 [Arthrobacter nitrophenolicus]
MLPTTGNPAANKALFRRAPAGRVFHRFQNLHKVPMSDLLQLRWALGNSVAVTAFNPIGNFALLHLVDSELSRRSTFQSALGPVPARQDHL